jgi:hypothetical protein
MKILPASTVPWAKPIRRRHSPSPGRLTSFRPCLRWEFGFSCAFCLLHEADMGLDDRGAFSVEPWVPNARRTSDPTYDDLFYACAFCNRARGAAPRVASSGAHLLRPDEVAWDQHFSLENDLLVPRAGDPDAAYTAQVYDLNDPRKVRLRRFRREAITTRLRFLRESEGLRKRLLDRVATSPTDDALAYLDVMQALESSVRAIASELLQLAAIPQDAAPRCRCGAAGALPEWFVSQTQELDLEA